MVYATTMSESQRVVLWQLILKEFGPNIQHVTGFDSIIAYKLSKFPYTSAYKY